MKQVSFAILIFLIAFSTSGQETKTITKKSTGYLEEYNVLTSDKKIRHGAYHRYKGKEASNETMVVEGTFDNDQKIGEWRFLEDGKLMNTYDFNSKEMKYASQSSEVGIALVNGIENEIMLDIPPLYLGGKSFLTSNLSKVMRYPEQARRMQIEGVVIVRLYVDENDNVSDVQIIRGIGAGCDEEVKKGLEKVENFWTAGKKDGKKIKAKYLMSVKFLLGVGSGTSILVM